MQALIDGDIICYRSAAICEKKIYSVHGIVFGNKREANAYCKEHELSQDAIETRLDIEPVQNALATAKRTLNSILDMTESDSYVVFLTGATNYRNDIVDNYKANRATLDKPYHLYAVKEYLINNWDAEISDGCEADDLMGIHQTDDTIIVTLDKDLDMIPGWHYNWVKDEKYFVTEEEGIKKFYLQLLTGDVTDNIIGLRGVGPKTAEKLLAGLVDEMDMFQVVEEQYKKHGREDDLLINARLLWIQTEHNQLWEAPNS